jgi:hypothetical protein
VYSCCISRDTILSLCVCVCVCVCVCQSQSNEPSNVLYAYLVICTFGDTKSTLERAVLSVAFDEVRHTLIVSVASIVFEYLVAIADTSAWDQSPSKYIRCTSIHHYRVPAIPQEVSGCVGTCGLTEPTPQVLALWYAVVIWKCCDCIEGR